MAYPPNIPKRKVPTPVKVAVVPQQNQVAILLQQGFSLHQQGKFNEATSIYEQILKLQPNHFDALQLSGAISAQTKQFTKAVDFLTRALKINPNHAPCFSNRGSALQELKRLDEALASYDKAISIQPDCAEAHYNRGNALKELKRLDEALASYDKAISIQPDSAEAHWNLSLCHLLGGNFKNGWEGYEWRCKNENIIKTSAVRNLPQPLWLGVESLQDKTILLHAEQGIGDAIQFSRYAPLVALLGAKVILEVPPSLLKLLKNLEGMNQIIARGDALPPFDYQCPLLSLPLALKTELHTIPPVSQHVISDSEKTAKWQTKLGEKAKPRVGLVWSGSVIHKNDHNRSLTLSQLLPYLSSNAEYVCLQKELRDIDKKLLMQQTEIKYFGDALEDFTDTAALCDLMDLVISVDTSGAHLAGTLGKPTWVLLPFSPDWRWLLGRNDSPWYPSAKLYRQEKIGDWDGVLEKIKSDLLTFN